jgi:hypothetical protein
MAWMAARKISFRYSSQAQMFRNKLTSSCTVHSHQVFAITYCLRCVHNSDSARVPGIVSTRPRQSGAGHNCLEVESDPAYEPAPPDHTPPRITSYCDGNDAPLSVVRVQDDGPLQSPTLALGSIPACRVHCQALAAPLGYYTSILLLSTVRPTDCFRLSALACLAVRPELYSRPNCSSLFRRSYLDLSPS